MRTRLTSAIALTLAGLIATGCTGSSDPLPGRPVDLPPGIEPPPADRPLPGETPSPLPGDTWFVSADQAFRDIYLRDDELDHSIYEYLYDYGEEEEEALLGDEESTAAAGDSYRVLGPGVLVNLHPTRGLQVIDISNPASPVMLGRLPLFARPVAMHVIGDQVVVLLHHWNSYHPASGQPGVSENEVTRITSEAVALVDVSDRTAPRLLSLAQLPGTIKTSRVVHSAGQHTLYVGHDERNPTRSAIITTVTSFAVQGDTLVQRAQIELDGNLDAITATGDVLLVAHCLPRSSETSVSVIDLDDTGAMALRDTVTVSGHVHRSVFMEYRGQTLRVISGRHGNELMAEQPSYLQTWDGSAPGRLVALDKKPFGATGTTLLSAVFLDDRAFAATISGHLYAFAIGSQGRVEVKNEWVVPDRNHALRPVLGSSRLISLQTNNNTSPSRITLSLYDTTDLTAPQPPLLARAQVTTNGGNQYTPASWPQHDSQALAVLEDAVDVRAPTGEIERGLILLPFWESDSASISGTQMITFSSSTLTRRGVMSIYGQRSAVLGQATAASISFGALSLYDTGDLDNPVTLASLPLVKDYAEMFRYGAYRVVRIASLSWQTPHRIEIYPEGVPIVETATPVASFAISSQARLLKMGARLVAVEQERGDNRTSLSTTITVYDLTNPRAPVQVGRFVNSELPLLNTLDGPPVWLYAVGDALVFASTRQHQDDTREPLCSEVPHRRNGCYYSNTEGCTFVAGARMCHHSSAGWWCVGDFALCTAHEGGDSSCEPIDPIDVPGVTEMQCEHGDWRSWSVYWLSVVDFTDPANPSMTRLSFPDEDQAAGLLLTGNDLYVTVKRRVEVPGDLRPYVQYFIRRLDLSGSGAPVMTPGINVPGELVAVQGSVLVTKDTLWGDRFVDTAIAKLELAGGEAHLLDYHRLRGRHVTDVAVDERGVVTVAHNQFWYPLAWYEQPWVPPSRRLSVYGPEAGRQTLLFEGPMAWWARFAGIVGDRALVEVPAGLLILNLSDPSRPQAQGFIRSYSNWVRQQPSRNGDTLSLAAGIFGFAEVDLATSRLPAPPMQ